MGKKQGIKRAKQTYQDMKNRCTNPKNCNYHNYGAKGVECHWETFDEFWSDMEEGYGDMLVLDRINPNGHYNKENCRWATAAENKRNQRMYRNNKSGVMGVMKEKSGYRSKWKAQWRDHTGQCSTSFSIDKYGEELAFFLACEKRELEIMKLNLLGYGYTKDHGSEKKICST